MQTCTDSPEQLETVQAQADMKMWCLDSHVPEYTHRQFQHERQVNQSCSLLVIWL